MEKLSKHQQSKLMEYLVSSLVKHQYYFVLFCCSIFSKLRKHLLKFILLGSGLSSFCFILVGQAAMPVWSFTRDASFPPNTSVTSTDFATVKYTITNNSSKPHRVVITPQTGVIQNNGPCLLGAGGSCTLILTIIGSALPASGLSGGPVLCQTNSDGVTPSPLMCCRPNPIDNLAITIVPHHLSMLPIPIQEATANQSFIYNLRSAVQFYDENAVAGIPAQGIVTPAEQDGLYFDQNSFSIVGTPNHTGTYLFKVAVRNANGSAEAVDFNVHVQANAKDKPVLKANHSMTSAVRNQKYSMNLMELVEPKTGFMVTNQISFSIDTKQPHPGWLHISKDDATMLIGMVPSDAAGQEVEITLIATSNTGGDSSLKVKIPIAYDPEKKPVISPFDLERAAGTNIYEDLSVHIKDPATDPKLKVSLEKVVPAAPWLSISNDNPTVLEGIVPDEATGQKYLLTLSANTAAGGSSESVVIPLQISVDKIRTPYFKAANPIIPLVYPGQPFFYDFVANKDIFPEYDNAPYEIAFAKNFIPPTWLRLENNKLISDMVSPDLKEDIDIKIVIKNIPGGTSEIYTLSLTVMN